MSDTEPNADRLLRLETAVAHLQHDLERLHQVTLDLQTELRQGMLRLSRLERQWEQWETPSEFRSAADERPPHY